MIRLTDEEIQQEIGGSLEIFMGIEYNTRKLLKAQLKKVVEYLREIGYDLEINVIHDKGVLGRHVFAIQNLKWQALLEEVK